MIYWMEDGSGVKFVIGVTGSDGMRVVIIRMLSVENMKIEERDVNWLG